jgi:hypothetical protein
MNSAYTFLETELIFVEKTHQKEIEECFCFLIDYLPPSYLLVVILAPAAISAPGIISLTPPPFPFSELPEPSKSFLAVIILLLLSSYQLSLRLFLK